MHLSIYDWIFKTVRIWMAIGAGEGTAEREKSDSKTKKVRGTDSYLGMGWVNVSFGGVDGGCRGYLAFIWIRKRAGKAVATTTKCPKLMHPLIPSARISP